MPRPRKPSYFPQRKCWRTMIDGERAYFGHDIPRDERPQIGGVPRRAWEALAALIAAAEGVKVDTTDPPVRWLANAFLQWREQERAADRLSGGQLAGDRSQLLLLLEYPGMDRIKVSALLPDLMDEFFEWLRARERAPGRHYTRHYVANVGKSIRTMLNWGCRPIRGRQPSRLLAENPLRGYKFPRPPKAVRGYVEGEVVRRWLRWAWARARAEFAETRTKTGKRVRRGVSRRFDRLFVLMIRFQRLTGCRPGEACDLRWTDIDHAAGKITIPADRHKTGEKTGKDRLIFLTPPVTRLLKAIERLPEHHATHVFTHKRGNHAVDRGQGDRLAGEPWPSGSAASAKVREWREAALAAGLKGIEGVGPRKLVAYINRHAYVSDAVSGGMSHEQAARLVGNSAEVVASTYSHAIEDADRRRAEGVLKDRGR